MKSLLQNKFFFITLVFVSSRLLNLFVFNGFDEINQVKYQSTNEQLLSYTFRWDSAFYRDIAVHGYEAPKHKMETGDTWYAFYPLFPFSFKLFSDLTGLSLEVSGLILSNICFLFSLYLFSVYCQRRCSNWRVTKMALGLLAFCPQNFIFSAFYTESLFLMLSLLALLAYDSKRYWVSSLFSGLLSAVRSNGLFVIAYYSYDILSDIIDTYRNRKSVLDYFKSNSSKLLPILFTPLGIFVFWWICYSTTGDAFAQSSTAKAGWNRELVFPFSKMAHFALGTFNAKFWLFSSLFYFTFSFVLLKRCWGRDFVFCLANFLLFYSANIADSMLRYCIVLFPVYLAISTVCEKRPTLYAVILMMFGVVNTLICGAWLKNYYLSI